MNLLVRNIILPAFLAVAATAPLAAQEQPIELAGDVKLVVTMTDDAGQSTTSFVAPEKVVPGDRLLFTTDFRNGGAELVENFVVTNPLPGAVQLASDADPALIVSVDGGTNWGQLDGLTVALEDGSSRAATHSDVTHVRWTLASVQPGESGRVEYPAIVR